MNKRINKIKGLTILILSIIMLGSLQKAQAFSVSKTSKLNEGSTQNQPSGREIIALKNGRFTINGKPFIPIGFNYWPSSTGVRCWEHFNIHEWEQDFKSIHKHGYNAVRMFLLWQDFQPGPQSVNQKDLNRLKEVCDAAARNHIWLVPTLFQGWMSGTNFVPKWAAGKNYIRNPQMRKAMALLAGDVAKTLRNEDNILAIDLANEIDVIQPNVRPSDVSTWTHQMSEAIKKERPGTIVTNGSAIRGASQTWPFSAEQVDLYSMHSYPFWNPIIPHRMTDFDATVAFGFNSAYSRSYGPTIEEEFGFAFGGDSKMMGRYLRANAASAFLSGANGFLYWCWSDFKTTKEPYQSIPSESSLGYVNGNGKPKVWSHYYDQVKDLVTKYAAYRPVTSGVTIYRPKSYDAGGKKADKALSTAFVSLVANGITPDISSQITNNIKLLVVPYTKLTIDEINTLNRYVENGGHLLITNVNLHDCSQYWEKLTDTRITEVVQDVDHIDLSVANGNIQMKYGSEIPVLKPISDQAKTIAESNGQIPMILENQNGKGKVVQFVGPIENAGSEKYNRTYIALWHKLLQLSDFESPIQISEPYVQAGLLKDKQGDRKLMLINHLNKQKDVTVRAYGQHWKVMLGAQNYEILTLK